MLSALLFEPHQDDAVLFACFSLIRHQPFVITVLESQLQEQRGTGVTQDERWGENNDALAGVLGLTWAQWDFSDINPPWDKIEEAVAGTKTWFNQEGNDSVVFAPRPEYGGHEHHNTIGQIVESVYGPRETTGYYTYTRGGGKSRGGFAVPFEPAWVQMKLEALACYHSQIRVEELNCWQHFTEDLNEYQEPLSIRPHER
jgi:hypothetical protein